MTHRIVSTVLRCVDMAEPDNAALLAAAGAGDQRSWEAIVQRYAGLVWSVARSYRLGTADAADVCQATWLRLVEHLHDIRDSGRLGAWLATTARREALGLLRRAGRDAPATDPIEMDWPDAGDAPVDHDVLREERDVELWQAFGMLPHSCQQLLRVLLAEPSPSYAEASAALGMPVGSIGPTRARCLDTLRRKLVV
jgi:RNA polymerase sigma factor (sigma-70 family)